jgi:hypothetical protein
LTYDCVHKLHPRRWSFIVAEHLFTDLADQRGICSFHHVLNQPSPLGILYHKASLYFSHYRRDLPPLQIRKRQGPAALFLSGLFFSLFSGACGGLGRNYSYKRCLRGFNKNGYNLFPSHPLQLIQVRVFKGPSSKYFTKNTSHDHTIKLPCRSFGKGLYYIKTVSNCWPAGTSTLLAF